MDFLKEFPSALSKIVEPVFGNSRLCFIAFVGLTLLLGLPAQWLVPVGLDVVQIRYRWIVGVVWFVFLLASVYHLIGFINLQWQVSKGPRERAKMLRLLRNLTEEQKSILRQFLDEHEAAIVCYTSGTTGMPKGVAYSHRSLWLQATSLCTANSLAIGATTRMLPAVPLYHVNGWGLPFAGLMAGAEIVLPGHSLHAADLLDLIERHQPDLAAGVPTVWSDVLQELRARGRSGLGALETISCGGAQVPNTLARAYADIGVEMVQAWGMTETSSMSTIARAPPWAGTDAERAHYFGTQGRVVCGLEIRVAEAGGETPADDDGAVGEIRIRGPWVTAGYLGGEGRDEFAGDWLRTGDLGSVDADGYLSLCDRVKDAIKSGGEWIPSLGLEQAIREHPAVGEVAVVAVDDPRWQERPAAVVVLKPGRSANAGELGAWLQTRVARWWVPSVWTVATELPRTSVGKIDKKRIRQMIKDGGFTAL